MDVEVEVDVDGTGQDDKGAQPNLPCLGKDG